MEVPSTVEAFGQCIDKETYMGLQSEKRSGL